MVSKTSGLWRPIVQVQAYSPGFETNDIVTAVDGMALNITLVSYADQLNFGLIACRRSVPHVQRMLEYLEQGLAELEAL